MVWKLGIPLVLLVGLWIAQTAGVPTITSQTAGDAGQAEAPLVCDHPNITDGDTFRCNGARVRLLGIDAPEMPGHCRPGRRCAEGDPDAAKDYLTSITRSTVRCAPEGQDHYGRTLARCSAGGVDLSCAMLKSSHAERRYSPITCP